MLEFSGCFSLRCNSSFINVIPKVDKPTLTKSYILTRLIGFQYKIIARILANRLENVVDHIVSLEQSIDVIRSTKSGQLSDG